MNWADFQPYVMPHVIGVPLPMLEHHARMAAIEFCKRTKCWIRSLTPMLTTGAHEIAMAPYAPGTRIFDVESVDVDGVDWPILDAGVGVKKSHGNTSDPFCFTQDHVALSIYPLQSSGSSVSVMVAMTPTMSAAELHDDLAQYVEHIAHGAVASLMRVPGQAFTSPLSDAHEAMFREQIKTESSRLARGSIAAGGGRIQPSFI